jgi:hypothetical protein
MLKRIFAISLLALFIVGSTQSQAFVHYRGATGAAVAKWPKHKAAGLHYLLDSRGTADIAGQDEFDEIRKALLEWENVTTSYMAWAPPDPFMADDLVPSPDGLNYIIIAASNDARLPVGTLQTGVMALTIVTEDKDNGQTTRNIRDCDVLINDDYFWTVDASDPNLGMFNLYAIVLHELGQFLGLDQNTIRHDLMDFDKLISSVDLQNKLTFAPIMFPVPYPTVDRITSDDVAGLSTLYPVDDYWDTTGRIQGNVVNALTGKAVFPVQVVAYDSISKKPVVGEMNSKDGSFIIRGLPTGNYFLFFEPTRTEYLPSDYYGTQNQRFLPTFYEGVLRTYSTSGDTVGLLNITQFTDMKQVHVNSGTTTSGIIQPIFLGLDPLELDVAEESDDELSQSRDLGLLENGVYKGFGVIEDVKNQSAEIRDKDIFTFFSNLGDLTRIEVFAQSLGSTLDARLRIYAFADLNSYLEEHPYVDPSRVFDLVPTLPEGEVDNDAFNPLNKDPAIEYRDERGGTIVVVVDRSPLQPALSSESTEVHYYQLVITKLSGVQSIPVESDPIPVLGFSLSAKELGIALNSQLVSVTFSIKDYNNDGDISYNPDNQAVVGDFQPPLFGQSDQESSGVSLWRNIGSDGFDYEAGNNGFKDDQITLSQVEVTEQSGSEIRVKMTISGQEIIPNFQKDKVDYWVCLRTSLNLSHGDDFTVSIPDGGIVLREPGGTLRAVFDGEYPSSSEQNHFVGDIVEFENTMAHLVTSGQIIDARSDAIPVIGINVKAGMGNGNYIHQIDVIVVGTNARWFLQVFDLSAGFTGVSHLNAILPLLLKGKDTFDLDDLDILTSDSRGGIGLYRDNDNLGEQGEQSGDGIFNLNAAEGNPDLAIELESIEITPLSRSQIPHGEVELLIPGSIRDLASNNTIAGIDAQAYKLTLTVKRTGQENLIRIPASDGTNFGTAGPDFFVVLRTSGNISALDSLLPVIRTGGVRIAQGLDSPWTPGDEVVSTPSFNRFDSSSVPRTSYMVCRPEPELLIRDLTDDFNNLQAVGSNNRMPVFSINANDRGQNSYNIFTTADWAIDTYFNQSYTLDAFRVLFTEVQQGEAAREIPLATGILMPTFQALQFMDEDPNIPAAGIALYIDDDTIAGNGEDDDNDGLIDEELLDGIDNDMDGSTDEDDFGDGDLAGESGKFDPMDDIHPGGRHFLNDRLVSLPGDSDDFFPYEPHISIRGVDNDTDYRLAEDIEVGTVENAIEFRIPLLMQVLNEGRDNSWNELYGLMKDPLTFGSAPVFKAGHVFYGTDVFVRTDFAPVWYIEERHEGLRPGQLTEVEVSGGINTDGFEPIGLFVSVDEPWNIATGFPVKVNYNAVLEIPDSDDGLMAGADYYVVIQATSEATPETQLRVEMPAGSLEYSIWQSVDTFFNGQRQGTGGNRVKTGRITIQGREILPTVRIAEPGPGVNVASEDQTFNVTWQADDPDSIAELKVYLDTDRSAGNPLVPGATQTRIELTSSPLREGINPEFYIVALDNVISDPRYRHFGFDLLDPRLQFYVVIEIWDKTDAQGAPDGQRIVSVYSDGYIVPFRGSLSGKVADYVKIHREGVITSVGEAPSFSSLEDVSDSAVDMELTASGAGLLGLLSNGLLRSSGSIDGLEFTIIGQGSVDLNRFGSAGGTRRISNAVDVEADFGSQEHQGGLALLSSLGEVAAYGSLHGLGYIADLEAEAMSRINSTPGLTAVDLELTPDFDGGLVLFSNGAVITAGSTGGGLALGASTAGVSAVDMTLLPGGNGYYLLFADGTVTAVQDAISELADEAQAFSQHNARDLELTFGPDGPGLLIMRGTGQVVAYGAVDLAYDGSITQNSDDYVGIEVYGSAGQDRQAIIDVYNQLYRAYTNEDLGSFMELVSPDYLDDSGNDRERLRKSLAQIFDIYEMGPSLAQRSDIALATDVENPIIQVVGNVASATVLTSDAYMLPEINFFDMQERADTGDIITTFRFPIAGSDNPDIRFSHDAIIEEIGDGRGWQLEIFDIERTGNFDLGADFAELDGLDPTVFMYDYIVSRNPMIKRITFEDRGPDGSEKIRLKYDGARGNNVYMLQFRKYYSDSLNTMAPPEVLIRHYPGREMVFRDVPLFWEFKFNGSQWKLTRGQIVMSIPVRTDDVDPTAETVQDPVGFSFEKNGPDIEFFEGDVDFHYFDEQIETVCEGGGVLNLTEQFNIVTIEAAVSRLSDLRDISQALLQPAIDAVEGEIYMVLTCDGRHFGLIEVVDMFDKAEEPEFDDENEDLTEAALIFNWRYEERFILGGE